MTEIIYEDENISLENCIGEFYYFDKKQPCNNRFFTDEKEAKEHLEKYKNNVLRV